MMYWINRKNEYKLLVDEKLLKFLQIKNIYEYKHLDDLILSIHQILPPIEDIFKQFGV
jgi:flagellar biosynthesis chaperone FliJ